MSAASYYDKSATQEEQPGPMHSGTQGYGQDMRQGMNEQQQQRGFNQQGYNEPSGNGIYSGQEPKMGNTNYAQGAQQMNGNGDYAQGAQQMNGNGNYAQGAQQMNGNGNYAQGAQHMNGNNNYAHGAQQMEGQGAQGDVADDRDTLTKCNDNPPDYEKKTSSRTSLFVE